MTPDQLVEALLAEEGLEESLQIVKGLKFNISSVGRALSDLKRVADRIVNVPDELAMPVLHDFLSVSDLLHKEVLLRYQELANKYQHATPEPAHQGPG